MAIGPLSVFIGSLKSVRANNPGLSFVKVNDECVGFVLMLPQWLNFLSGPSYETVQSVLRDGSHKKEGERR